jgi:hypothetical protein
LFLHFRRTATAFFRLIRLRRFFLRPNFIQGFFPGGLFLVSKQVLEHRTPMFGGVILDNRGLHCFFPGVPRRRQINDLSRRGGWRIFSVEGLRAGMFRRWLLWCKRAARLGRAGGLRGLLFLQARFQLVIRHSQNLLFLKLKKARPHGPASLKIFPPFFFEICNQHHSFLNPGHKKTSLFIKK